ncbi:MAG: DUF420 domain-containing protein [Proteobacteria bacterium]|nr:DUF420 domain-containing protein [Pseudomonadota bacterium]
MTGFIPGSRGSFMLDVVVVAMIAILPVLGYAIKLAKAGRYPAHRYTMLILAAVLILAVACFEVEMRLKGWEHLAKASPFFDTSLMYFLGIHISISVSTTVLLIVTVCLALRAFSRPLAPGIHSKTHRRLGKLTAVGLTLTSVSGWIFYWMAFVAN